MKVIISPAKTMNVETEIMETRHLPVFIDQAEEVESWLKTQSYDQLKKLWSCSEKIAQMNFERVQSMDLRRNLTPAILAYEGIQYQYLAPSVFTFDEFEYVEEHLRILSGLYGILRPMDGVVPYRLEMQSKAKIGQATNLYDFWKDSIYRELTADDNIIINLASKEYSKVIEPYIQEPVRMITCVFAQLIEEKPVQKATFAKMARGEMVRYMALNRADSIEDLKEFDALGYEYSEEFSGEDELVFIKKEK